MLAKVISYADTRAEAAHLLASALARAKVHGLTTNRDLLVRVLRHPAFLAGDTDTAFFTTHGLDVLARPLASPESVELSAIAAALADAARNRRGARVNGRLPSGWRNLPAEPQRKTFGTDTTGPGADIEVRYWFTRAGLRVDGHGGLCLVSATPELVVLDVPGELGAVRRRFEVARYGALTFVDSPMGPVSLIQRPRFVDPSAQVADGSLLAPIPGTVIRVAAAVGDHVRPGQPILWIEAMKMEHTIAAPAVGVLTELDVSVGQSVEVGAVLAVVDETADARVEHTASAQTGERI
jgi:propionyl-CoA carboxylase alpha chain